MNEECFSFDGRVQRHCEGKKTSIYIYIYHLKQWESFFCFWNIKQMQIAIGEKEEDDDIVEVILS